MLLCAVLEEGFRPTLVEGLPILNRILIIFRVIIHPKGTWTLIAGPLLILFLSRARSENCSLKVLKSNNHYSNII